MIHMNQSTSDIADHMSVHLHNVWTEAAIAYEVLATNCLPVYMCTIP